MVILVFFASFAVLVSNSNSASAEILAIAAWTVISSLPFIFEAFSNSDAIKGFYIYFFLILDAPSYSSSICNWLPYST